MRRRCAEVGCALGAAVVLVGLGGLGSAWAVQPTEEPVEEAAPEGAAGAEVVEAPEAEEGVAEDQAPDYGGVWYEREHLTGGWGGFRNRLARSGLTVEPAWTQVVQGVVSGGRRRDWDYGGNLDVPVTLDFERMGLGPAGSLTVRGESRYGETVNDDTGSFTPVNTRGYFPLAIGGIDEGIPLAITEVAYAVTVLETVDITVGKMLMASGDPSEFAAGVGQSQFMDSNFIYNAATSQTAPYSTLGAEVDWSPAAWITVSNAVFETTDSSTTTGFDDLDDGWTWWGQVATQYRLGELPGGFNAGGQYAFDGEFTEIGGKLTLVPGGVAAATVSDSWAVFFGAWQYVVTLEEAPQEIDAWDDRADVRGVGVFARVGFADPDANPVDWSVSVGVGGRGVLPGREEDAFGAGYYSTRVQDAVAFEALGLAKYGEGFEAFYAIALTPAVALTLDVQWVDGGLPGTEGAWVVGCRVQIEF